MAAARERPRELRDGAPPDWSPVPEHDAAPGRRAVVGIVVRSGIGVLVAGVLFALGHRIPAAVLVTVLLVVTAASLRRPAVAATIDRLTQKLQYVVGRTLGVVLLGAIGLLVITPIAFVLRLVRHDPLALGARADDPSFWRPVPVPGPRRAARLQRRPFAYERLPAHAGEGRRPGLLRLRAALGLVVVVLLADVAVGSALDAVRPDLGAAPGSLLTHPDAAAARGEPWVRELGDEISTVWFNRPYDPYLAWSLPDFHGRHLDITDGIRRTVAPPPAPSAGRPVEVFLFGGSTMFGLFQRDAGTIPSQLARLAAADGVALRVVNHGRLAYTNWQEVLLLQQLVTRGERPDVAVFYDGFNELLAQFQLAPHDEPSHVGAADAERILGDARDDDAGSLPDAVHRAWADVSITHRVGRKAGLLRMPGTGASGTVWTGDQREGAARRGRNAASVHARGVDLARRLGRSYGFRTAFFWQPSVFSKRVRPGEEEFLGYLGADEEAWRTADRAARGRLRAPVVDVGDALDPVPAPVMYDFVHTNEAGAGAVARRLYAELRPVLRRAGEDGGR